MGVNPQVVDLLEVALNEVGGSYRNLSFVQFGNLFFTGGLEKKPLPGERRPFKAISAYFLSKGAARVVDIDLCFKKVTERHQRLDLGKPLGKWAGKFGWLNNFGTSEHVHNQYHCFKNAHDLVRVGGVMVHTVPAAGSWPRHCRYWYKLSFFTRLAILNGYRVVLEELRPKPKPAREMVCAVLVKESKTPFCDEESFDTAWP